jgi:quinohemoprotein ethanol dehydrogenase
MIKNRPFLVTAVFLIGVLAFLVMMTITLENKSVDVTKEVPNTDTTPVDTEPEPEVEDPTPPAFTAEELAAVPTKNWFANGGSVYNQRYSLLDEINTSNVANLKGKWVTHLGSGFEFKYSGESSPIVYNGVMYVNTGAHEVSALDVRTGDILWTYKPDLPELTTVCCGWTSRGVGIG